MRQTKGFTFLCERRGLKDLSPLFCSSQDNLFVGAGVQPLSQLEADLPMAENPPFAKGDYSEFPLF
ncbi:MAG: hypothetical protein AMJ91_03135 [candidate division Zixibacteria bacterium SM23_73_3]|nr:MAG: hypothetical protein AMJ91_03135 [candidate division Zixibacteria bacterium SM23_73_3]